MSRLALTVAALAVAATLAGCGGDSLNTNDLQGEDNSSLTDYCASVKEAKASFGGLDAGSITPTKIESMRSKLEDLAAQAPDSVADDYKTLTGGFDKIDKVLATVGLSLRDLANQQKMAKAMASASPQQMQAIQDAAASMGDQDFEAANTAIRKEIKADCGISMGS
jgi:hypothetical protein